MATQVHAESVKITIDGEEISDRPLSDAEFREMLDEWASKPREPVGPLYVYIHPVNMELYFKTRRDRVRAKLLIRANNEAKRRERGSSRSKRPE